MKELQSEDQNVLLCQPFYVHNWISQYTFFFVEHPLAVCFLQSIVNPTNLNSISYCLRYYFSVFYLKKKKWIGRLM